MAKVEVIDTHPEHSIYHIRFFITHKGKDAEAKTYEFMCDPDNLESARKAAHNYLDKMINEIEDDRTN